MNALRRRDKSASRRMTTGPAISHGGTSRAEPGTSAPPPRAGATAKPVPERTSPNALQWKRGLTRTPAATRWLAGASSGIAPIRPEGRRSTCRPPLLPTSGVRPRRRSPALFAAKNGSIQRSPWAWMTAGPTRIAAPWSVVRSRGRAAAACARAAARARPLTVRPRGNAQLCRTRASMRSASPATSSDAGPSKRSET
jgi:hypothetical protein